MQIGRKFVTFPICARTMWYEEKVSNFEIAVAKLKKKIAKHQICHTLPERSVCYAPHKFVAPKDF